jgi:hypothetical protein
MNIEELNKQLIAASENDTLPMGLLHGKIGLCIYLYRLAKTHSNEDYGESAEQLLDEIFKHIGEVKSIDIENGLSGIGLGISYLIRNGYVQGDENEVLRDLDDEIFKQVCFEGTIKDNAGILIQILLYICVRKQNLQKEQEYLFNELAVHIVNILHTKIDQVLNDNIIEFAINSNLPLFLFALGKMYETGIYNYKIERIMREITPFLLSQYGYRDSKRLYLLWGIEKINRHINDERLTKYCNLLSSQINLDNLLDEFRNKNIFIKKGLAGLCLLMLTLEGNIKTGI